MKCPICEKEMETGYVQGRQRIAWVKMKHKASLIPQKGEILLENHSFADFLFAADLCRGCKKIVLDYSNSDYQEG